MIRTLVLTPCSAKKKGQVPEPALAADLADPKRREQVKSRLAEHSLPAAEMYTGRHHRLVMKGAQAVWQQWGSSALDLAILSGGFGVLRADETIIPYLGYPEARPSPLLGERVDVDPEQFRTLMDEFYTLRGWDRRTGWPTCDALKGLDMGDIARGMAHSGKMPDGAGIRNLKSPSRCAPISRQTPPAT